MSDQNWRTGVDSGDYFLQQQKKTQINSRRPTVRKASDLVGPGINAGAVRITDFNDVLATYNGYYAYASVGGSMDDDVDLFHAPEANANFIGVVTSDAAFGGMQVFWEFSTDGSTENDKKYERMFFRSPMDTSNITFGNWVLITSGQQELPYLEWGPGITGYGITSDATTFFSIHAGIGSSDYTAAAVGVLSPISAGAPTQTNILADGLYLLQGQTSALVDHRGAIGSSNGGFDYAVQAANVNPAGTVFTTNLSALGFITAGSHIWLNAQQNSGSTATFGGRLRVIRLSPSAGLI